jgi:hypothetical protein
LTTRKACSLASGARPRAHAIDHSPALDQRPEGGRPPLAPITYFPTLKQLAIVFLPVRLVAEQLDAPVRAEAQAVE